MSVPPEVTQRVVAAVRAGHEAVDLALVDAGIVDMNDIVEIWKSKPIPEGPVVLRKALPDDVKAKMVALVGGMHETDAQCAYNIAAGDTAGFAPITHDAYLTMIELRKAQTAQTN